MSGVIRYDPPVTSVKIGYARCSTDKQNLEAKQPILLGFGVSAELIYSDRAYCSPSRDRAQITSSAA